jgi:YesN/AraC family two-component response regulator
MSQPSPSPPQKQYYRLRVLIADDSSEARRGTRMMLAMHPGIEVVAIARNGRQAVELATTHKPDIAIMDINMPEMDGLSAIRTIRQALPNTVYIVISAERDEKTMNAATAAGAATYLIKPFTYEDLDNALRRCARIWLANRQRAGEAARLPAQDLNALKHLAQEYSKVRRTDTQAMAVYEKLASDPHCELRWLMILAMAYVIRQEWSKLKLLAARLEARRT